VNSRKDDALACCLPHSPPRPLMGRDHVLDRPTKFMSTGRAVGPRFPQTPPRGNAPHESHAHSLSGVRLASVVSSVQARSRLNKHADRKRNLGVISARASRSPTSSSLDSTQHVGALPSTVRLRRTLREIGAPRTASPSVTRGPYLRADAIVRHKEERTS
jgi:hypothetical protein